HLPRYEGVSTYGVLNDWLYYMAHYHEAKAKGMKTGLVCKSSSLVTSMEEKPVESAWLVYPNPSVGSFSLRADKSMDRISVVDVLGRSVLVRDENGNRADGEFGSELSH